MKKWVWFLLAICFALTACGGDPIDTGKNPPSGGSGENPCDYTIAVDSGEAINILQITDPQITEGGIEQLNSKCFKYIDYAIEESQPDLIIVTGDIIYGRYDQNGNLLSALIILRKKKSRGRRYSEITTTSRQREQIGSANSLKRRSTVILSEEKIWATTAAIRSALRSAER